MHTLQIGSMECAKRIGANEPAPHYGRTGMTQTPWKSTGIKHDYTATTAQAGCDRDPKKGAYSGQSEPAEPDALQFIKELFRNRLKTKYFFVLNTK
jgi:hypothetical protein